MTIEPTKKQMELIEAALSGKYSMILFGGAVGGAKTAGLFLLFFVAHRIYPGIQVYFVRKDLATIERNSYATWNEIIGNYGTPKGLKADRRADNKNPMLSFEDGSNLIFFGENFEKDKNLTRWSGLIPNWFFADEINEMTYNGYKKMYERVGRYRLPGKNPKPLIVGTCNPSNGWVKEEIYDKWKKGVLPDHILYIPSKITDNPHLSKEYVENLMHLPVYEREVFVNGNWDVQLKTGGEFWKSFELNKHVLPLFYDDSTTLHITVDNNVYPYIAISVWQVIKQGEYEIAKQIHEIPAKDPDNTATSAAKLFVNWALSNEYEDVVFIYGDQTTTQRNTIDDNKKSFLDKFTSEISKMFLIRKRIPSKNPPVALSGEFINAIYENNFDKKQILINEVCKESINDYILTKQDKDGGILKTRTKNPSTGVSYEEYGHFSDIKRYFLTQVFKESFSKFKRRLNPVDSYNRGGQVTNRKF